MGLGSDDSELPVIDDSLNTRRNLSFLFDFMIRMLPMMVLVSKT